MRNPWIVLLIHLCIALGVALILFLSVRMFLNVYTRHGKTVDVPDFSAMTVEQAGSLAKENGLRIEVTDSVHIKNMQKGTVYKQSPSPGSKVKKDKRITLTVNAKTGRMVTMPDLVGLSMRQAKAELRSRGLVLGRMQYVRDMATNNVLKQLSSGVDIEPGVQVECESVIDLVLGLNNQDFITYVPDVVGVKRLTAVDIIHDNSLNIKELCFDESVSSYDDSLNACVWRQKPAGSDSLKVGMGTNVTLYLTLDPDKLPVKEVRE